MLAAGNQAKVVPFHLMTHSRPTFADRYTYVCMLLMGPSVLAPIFRSLIDKVEQGNKGMGKLLWPAASASGLALVAYYST